MNIGFHHSEETKQLISLANKGRHRSEEVRKKMSLARIGQTYSQKPIKFIVNEKGCHICISHSIGSSGYPSVNRNNKKFLMSHYIYEQTTGKEIPKGIYVLHRCDNPACINFEHLFLGTQLDNVKDMCAKGRHGHKNQNGENNDSAKLTEKQILEIRKDTRMPRFISKDYHISKSTIGAIKRRIIWKHI
jgi:hypothetical protein